jgi:geranylgeranyl diphosphate synthase type II
LTLAGLERVLEERRLLLEEALRQLAPSSESPVVVAAVADSLFAPAKRLRPILALLVAEVLQGDPKSVLPAACAVEMVHTASLILDDLPCMDDATTRRGRPACHVTHGEATALLAAFALLNRAYEILAEGWTSGPDPQGRAAIAQGLARAVGLRGMIAGQAADLEMTGKSVDFPTLEFIHSRKTGALFIAAAALGAQAARAEPAEKDVKKTTFVSFAGVEGAKQLARELVKVSQEALAGFGPRAQALLDLASYVVTRRR